MSVARKYGPPASLVLSVAAFVLAGLGKRSPVDPEGLRKLEAEADSSDRHGRSLDRKLDGLNRAAVAFDEATAALEEKISGAEAEVRESYMKALRGMVAELAPKACDKGWNAFMAAMRPENFDYFRFKGEALQVLKLDQKKADELARILVEEKRGQSDARRKSGRDKKKRAVLLGDIKRGVEEKLRALLSKEEYARYVQWRKAGN